MPSKLLNGDTMQLDEALTQISEIRQRMAKSQTFRGFRAASAAMSALMTFAAALVQSMFLPRPTEHLDLYLGLWIFVAIFGLLIGAVEIITRHRRIGSELQSQTTWLAVEALAPGLIAGAMLTYVLIRFDSANAWMLPGLWSVMFSLSLFAASRVLPRLIVIAACYNLLTGLLCIALGQGEQALAPWTMALCFGGGQILAAGVLYWALERHHDSE